MVEPSFFLSFIFFSSWLSSEVHAWLDTPYLKVKRLLDGPLLPLAFATGLLPSFSSSFTYVQMLQLHAEKGCKISTQLGDKRQSLTLLGKVSTANLNHSGYVERKLEPHFDSF